MKPFHFADEHQEMLYTPETRRLRIAFLKGGGIDMILPPAEARRLSKSLWYSSN